MPARLLAWLSPRAHQLQSEVQSLVGATGAWTAPSSLTTFLTFQDLWLWIAYVLLFVFTHHLVESPRRLRSLSLWLFLMGVGFGIFGLGQWFMGVKEAMGPDNLHQGLKATASFGNRNHFAAFQEMLLLVGFGWIASFLHEQHRRAPDRSNQQEAKARAMVLGLGLCVIALSLLFSVSRSGITAAAIGCAIFLLLSRDRASPPATLNSTPTSGAARTQASARTQVLLAIGGFTLALFAWIGVDPVVSRFELVPGELEAEQGRFTVWQDSLPAVRDYWLTGSGLSSFQHIYPNYRTFGGLRFYSWAHNDYLQLAIEVGMPGFVLALAIFIGLIVRAWTIQKSLNSRTMRKLHAGYCAAATAIGLHSFTDFSLHLPANAAVLAVVLGAMTGVSSRTGTGTGAKLRRRRKGTDGAEASRR